MASNISRSTSRRRYHISPHFRRLAGPAIINKACCLRRYPSDTENVPLPALSATALNTAGHHGPVSTLRGGTEDRAPHTKGAGTTGGTLSTWIGEASDHGIVV